MAWTASPIMTSLPEADSHLFVGRIEIKGHFVVLSIMLIILTSLIKSS